MSWRPLGVALLICLAGCSVGSGGGPARTTATPAEVPDPNASVPGTVPSPPGITGGTVVDAAALVGAHQEALAGESYVWRKRLVERGANGTRRVEQTVRAAVANETHFRYDRHTRGSRAGNESFSVYAAGGRQYVRVDDNVASVRYAAGAITGGVPDSDVILESRLAETNVTVDRIETPEGVRFRVVSTPASRNATLRATVRPDGLIERLSTSFPIGDGRLTYVGTVRVGPTAVDPPSWLPTARNRTDYPEDP